MFAFIFYNVDENMEVHNMQITTYIELENQEVETIARAKMIFDTEQVNKEIVETCVEGFEIEATGEKISSEEGIQIVFDHLKKKGIVPAMVEDFSFEMPSCERLIKSEQELPQNVVITFVVD